MKVYNVRLTVLSRTDSALTNVISKQFINLCSFF